MMSSDKLKVLIVVQNDLMGGAEQLLKLLANEYSLSKTAVTVVIMREPLQRGWDDIHEEVDVKYLNTKTYFPGILKLASHMVKIANRNDFDYVFSSNININALLGLLRKLNLIRPRKLIVRETTSVFLRITGVKKYFHVVKYLLGYSSPDLVICQTDLMKQQFLDHVKSSQTWNLKTIQNPLDIIKTVTLSKEKISEFNFVADRRYIISAGRFIHEKGFDILIHSFAKIAHLFPDVDLLIIGEGNLRNEYDQLIRALNLNGRVILPGFMKNPMPFFKHAALCVVSSRIEGFPNVLLQMLALNDRVVSTLCAGSIISIPSVYTCGIDDANLLSESMISALTNEPVKEVIIAKKAFLDSISVSNYIEIIDKALNE